MKKLGIAAAALAVLGFIISSVVSRVPSEVPPAESSDLTEVSSPEPPIQPTRRSEPTRSAAPRVAEPSRAAPAISFLTEIQVCLAERSEDVRQVKFLELLQRMGPQDTRGVMQLIDEAEKQGRNLATERGAFWRRRGAIDPQQAIADLDQKLAAINPVSIGSPGNPGADFAEAQRLRDSTAQLFTGWATSDAASAQAWLSTHTDHPQFSVALNGFVAGYAKSDPAGATSFLFANLAAGDPLLADSARRVSREIMEQSSPAGAALWFNQLPTDEAGINARKAVILEITERLTQQDVAAAVMLTEAQAGTPWRSWQSIELVVDRFAAQDPAAAMSWIDSLPRDPSNGGISGVGNVVRNWVRQDAAGFERWIAGADWNSRLFAQAAGDYALVLASENYDLAMQWYNLIPESHPRVRAYFGPILQRRAPRPPNP